MSEENEFPEESETSGETPVERIQVVIIGRPNVGKSTLFNRLYGRRRALVHDVAGVTRDRLIEETDWWLHRKKLSVTLVDTGGMGGDRFAKEIQEQVEAALEHARGNGVALFVLDAQTGVTPDDEALLRALNKAGALKQLPVIGVVNKVDDDKHEQNAADFYELGLETILTISAEHGRGIDDLKIAVAAAVGFAHDPEDPDHEDDDWTQKTARPEDSNPVRIAIIGRPNVGKSTLVNALLGEERMIASPVAGTTVDSIDSFATINDKPFVLIDTAGIRRKSKTEQGIEVLSVVQTRKALERCDVAILMVDGQGGITDQDEKIGSLIEEVGCGVILAINKWDTQRKDPGFTKEIAAELVRKKMAYLRYAPILFLSALRGEGFEGLGDLVEEILNQRELKISTRDFTDWIRKEATVHNPANVKFFLCHQTGRHPPTFVCHVNDPEKIHFSLARHLMNALRERWGFMGNPVRLLFKEGKNRKSLPKKKPEAKSVRAPKFKKPAK